MSALIQAFRPTADYRKKGRHEPSGPSGSFQEIDRYFQRIFLMSSFFIYGGLHRLQLFELERRRYALAADLARKEHL